MTSKERVLNRTRADGMARGRVDALDLASRASGMDGTAIIAEQNHIPAWNENATYTEKHIGFPVQDNDQVFEILQPHTPAHNPGFRPADLPAIYSVKHTKDPKKAKPYMAPSGTSGMYMTDECCVVGSGVYRSTINDNVWNPIDYPDGWFYLGEVEEVQG